MWGSTILNRTEQNRTEQALIVYYKEQASYYINLAIFRLYEEIGLFDNLKFANYTVKNLRDTFGSSGRLDSEYYQEKYDRLFEKLNKFNIKKLKEISNINRGELVNDILYNSGNVDYIRGNNITNFVVDDESVKVDVNVNDYRSIENNDIVFAVVGSVGQIAMYNKKEKAIVSNNLGVIQIKKDGVHANYLSLVLNSLVGQLQFEKYQTRTAQPKISIEDVKNFLIPIIAKEKQEQISKLLIESENLRRESKSLLEKAIKSVEMAIEGGEEKATAYLNS